MGGPGLITVSSCSNCPGCNDCSRDSLDKDWHLPLLCVLGHSAFVSNSGYLMDGSYLVHRTLFVLPTLGW